MKLLSVVSRHKNLLYCIKKNPNCIWIYPFKGPFTPSESESEKDQRAGKRDQRKNFKHQRKFQLSFLLSLDVNGLLYYFWLIYFPIAML